MSARRGARALWLIVGATAMGVGLWVFQFIGILALDLPVPVRYHYPTLLLSLLLSIFLPGLGLSATSQQRKGLAQAVVASIAVGIGMAAIPSMMTSAMRVPARMEHRWGLVALTGAFAIVIFLLILLLVFRVLYMRRPQLSGKIVGSIILGSGMALLPYLTLATLRFYSSPANVDLSRTVGFSPLRVFALACTAFLVLSGVILTSVLQGFLESQEEVAEKAQERETFFRNLAEAVPQIVWIADVHGQTTYINKRWYEMTGAKEGDSLPSGWIDTVHPDDRAPCLEKFQRCLRTGETFEIEYRLHDAIRGYRWYLDRAVPLRDEHGAIQQWFGTCTDIEEQKLYQQNLEQQIKERTEELAETNLRLQQEMWEKDSARQSLDRQTEEMMKSLKERSNRATLLAKMGELLQSCVTREEVFTAALGFAPKIFPSIGGGLALFNSSRNLLEFTGQWHDCQLPVTTFEADSCWALRTGHPHLVPSGDSTACCRHAAGIVNTYLCVPILAQGEVLGILHIQATGKDHGLGEAEMSFMTTFSSQIGLSVANIRLRDALRAQSTKDPLTGLYNRRYLSEMLDREIRRAIRSEQHLGILMLDLDQFKNFNDTYGHDAGDAVLRETASYLVRSIRAEDFVCRYGGEEFVLVLPTADLHAATARAERIRAKLHDLVVMQGGRSLGLITVSIGVAALPDHGLNEKGLLQAADAALYRAKREGRDRVAVAVPGHDAGTDAVGTAASQS